MIDIERLAREAAKGHPDYTPDIDPPEPELMAFFERFAALVRNEVLEEAAKVCDDDADSHHENQHGASDGRYDWKEDSARDCAAAIRSLKTDPNDKLTR